MWPGLDEETLSRINDLNDMLGQLELDQLPEQILDIPYGRFGAELLELFWRFVEATCSDANTEPARLCYFLWNMMQKPPNEVFDDCVLDPNRAATWSADVTERLVRVTDPDAQAEGDFYRARVELMELMRLEASEPLAPWYAAFRDEVHRIHGWWSRRMGIDDHIKTWARERRVNIDEFTEYAQTYAAKPKPEDDDEWACKVREMSGRTLVPTLGVRGVDVSYCQDRSRDNLGTASKGSMCYFNLIDEMGVLVLMIGRAGAGFEDGAFIDFPAGYHSLARAQGNITIVSRSRGLLGAVTVRNMMGQADRAAFRSAFHKLSRKRIKFAS